ncbi:gas vesicle protein GvpO, halophile-type [Halostagnicola sp. A-GB9-2]|uniref:gas vesicle protein GvpO, halophile-type n=1 Tax=Halostagnicola sp. A-GB9-2 TaxID=3048066 RepID=UPI0024BFAFF7|nr:gas vesicle protein [Halostagnicola sp. A-GB9-2]MDJ1433024.1 gas vesicle protein [Halostagnicola sp. A-GB9-2]
MAEAGTDTTERCQAVTDDGERCSRPAQDDGFCYQHDESDSTVSDSQTTEQQEQAQEQDQESADSDSSQTASMAGEETTDPEDVDTSSLEDSDLEMDDVDESKIEGVLAVRRTVQSTAGELIGYRFDGVSEITPTDEGWRAVAEVVERASVPDTQDVLGRYEIELDEDAVVLGYQRIDRYRRGDTGSFESK